MKNILRSYFYLFAIAGLLILLDQYTKFLVTSNLQLGESMCIIESLCDHVQIVHWFNTGVAFGLFQGNSSFFIVINSIVVVAIIIFYGAIPEQDWLLKIALMFETGGALGNLIDRIRIGHVTDFVSIGKFPVFNVADACINIGVGIMILSVLLEERKKKQQAHLVQDDADFFADDSVLPEGLDLADEPEQQEQLDTNMVEDTSSIEDAGSIDIALNQSEEIQK